MGLGEPAERSDYEPENRLRVGDFVRVTDAYWRRTGLDCSGTVVALLPVPDAMIEIVGSAYWAKLSGHDHLLALSVLEPIER
jgi:hypothetical protein